MRYAFLQFPILGQGSVGAAVATECAAEQGRFWEYHGALFEAAASQGRAVFSGEGLVGLAGEQGLDGDQFQSCFTEGRGLDLIRADAEAVAALGVRSTPTIFINDVAYVGLKTFDFYRARIEEALSNQ